jgi:hypothetical protein
MKSPGYFDDKYWSSYRVSRGLTFDTTTEEDKRCKKKVHAMENKVDCMSGIMQHWLAFMSKKNIQIRISSLKWNQLFMILWASTQPVSHPFSNCTCYLSIWLKGVVCFFVGLP